MDTKKQKLIALSKKLFSGRLLFVNIFLVAAISRIIYWGALEKLPYLKIPILDAKTYLKWAEQIISGTEKPQAFFTEPFYAYFLVFIKKILALDPAFGAVLIQTILGLTFPFVIYHLAKKIFNSPVAVISALAVALYGPFIFYENLLLKTFFEIYFLSLFLLLFLHFLEDKKIQKFLGLGLLLGVLIIIKGNNLILLPLLAGYIFLFDERTKKQKLISVAIFVLGAVVVISPITIRNYLVAKDFVLVNYSLGTNFYQGNFYGSDGSILHPEFVRNDPEFEEIDAYKMAEAYTEKKLKPSETSSFWLKKTFAEMSEHPGYWAKNMGRKILLLINQKEPSDNYDYYYYQKRVSLLKFLPGSALAINLGLAGILMLFLARYFFPDFNQKKDREKWQWHLLVLTIIAAYAFSIVIFHVNSRYRMPLMPLLIIYAGAFLYSLYLSFRKLNIVSTLSHLFLILLLFIITNIKLESLSYITDSTTNNNIGSEFMKKKEYTQAENFLKLAADENNQTNLAFSNLYSLYLMGGDVSLARENLLKAIKNRPDETAHYERLEILDEVNQMTAKEINVFLDKRKNNGEAMIYDPDFYEAKRLIKDEKFEQARKLLLRSAEKHKEPENTLLNLAYVEKKLDQRSEAIDLLQIVIDKNPYFIPAFYNLSNTYMENKEYDKALPLLEKIYSLTPEFQNAWENLIEASIKTKSENAGQVIFLYIKNYKESDNPIKKKQAEKYQKLLDDSQKTESMLQKK